MIEVIVKFLTTTDSKKTSAKSTTPTAKPTTISSTGVEGSVAGSTLQDSSGRGYPVGANFHVREPTSATNAAIRRGQSSNPAVNENTLTSNSPNGKPLTYPPTSVPPAREFSSVPSRSESSTPPQSDYLWTDDGSTKQSKVERKKYKYVASLSKEDVVTVNPRAGAKAHGSLGMVTSGVAVLQGSSHEPSRERLHKPLCSFEYPYQPKLKPYSRNQELKITGVMANQKEATTGSSKSCKFFAYCYGVWRRCAHPHFCQ